MNLRSQILQKCRDEFSYLQKVRRHIHKHPELGFEVHETADFVVQELSSLTNLKIRTKIGQTGVVADLDVPGATRRIALRADMDALPIQEQNTCDYRSVYPGKAHMCGHDAHTAMLLAAARILSQHQGELNAHVRFIFQPNEESFPGGAPSMIEDGVLEGVDEIYGMHVWPLIPSKHYGLIRGPAMARVDNFKINIQGVGGHASIPHKAIDPILVGSQLVNALQTIVSRNVNAGDAAVLTVTQFHAGTTHNVIPDHAFLEGTIRTFDESVGDLVIRRLKEIVEGFEKSFSAKISVEVAQGYPVLNNHSEAVSFTEQSLLHLFPEKKIDSYKAACSLGAEDFAYYLQKIPGCYVFLGSANQEKGIVAICHDPKFDIDEECMIYGTALHCQWALNF